MTTGDSEALGDACSMLSRDGIQHRESHCDCKVPGNTSEYSLELAQDLKAIHGLNAPEAELANILSTEILAEINREVIRTIYKIAEQGLTINTPHTWRVRPRR